MPHSILIAVFRSHCPCKCPMLAAIFRSSRTYMRSYPPYQVSYKRTWAVPSLRDPHPRTTIACAEATALAEDDTITHLKSIQMENFALVKEQTVKLEPGLNVITGESGAGKSVLVQAFGQLLGVPTLENCIRQPSTMAAVEGCFQISQRTAVYLTNKLSDLRLPTKAYTPTHKSGNLMSRMIIRREISQTPNGLRSRCTVNGIVTSVRVLREVGNLLVDVNGQNSSQALKESGMQLNLLDRIAGTSTKASRFASKLTHMQSLEQKIRDLLALGDEQERDRLQELCDRTGALNLEEGEEMALKKDLRKMEFRRGIAEQCSTISTSLTGDGFGGGGIVDAIQGVMSQLREVSRKEEANSGGEDEDDSEGVEMVEGAIDALATAIGKIHNAEDALASYSEHCRFDELKYEEVNERLRKIEILLRDFDCHTSKDALDMAKEAGRKLDTWYHMQDKQTEWGTELEELKGEIIQEGCELSFQRHSSAGRLRSAVEQCLEQLAMTSSRFDVRISWEKAYLDGAGLTIPEELAQRVGEQGGVSYRPKSSGFDSVEFLLAAGPQEPLRPLGAVASGGESSRLMLALKSAPVAMANQDILGDSSSTSTKRGASESSSIHEGLDNNEVAPIMVLDELDSGVGGRLGETVGKMLTTLPESSATPTAQVLCVSHLPQVAAYARHHIKVQKSESLEGRMETTFSILSDPGDRIQEITEMLGVGRSAAMNLLYNAQEWVPERADLMEELAKKDTVQGEQ